MGKTTSLNGSEIVNYILDNNITLREYSRLVNIPMPTLYYHVKKYSGARKQELCDFLAQNQQISRKNCGYYHWKEKNIKKSVDK